MNVYHHSSVGSICNEHLHKLDRKQVAELMKNNEMTTVAFWVYFNNLEMTTTRCTIIHS